MYHNKISPHSKRRTIRKKASRGYDLTKCSLCGDFLYGRALYEDGRCWLCRYVGLPTCSECDAYIRDEDQRHPGLCGDCFRSQQGRDRAKIKANLAEENKQKEYRKRLAIIQPVEHRITSEHVCRTLVGSVLICGRPVMRGKEYCFEHSPHHSSAGETLDRILGQTDG